MAETVETRSEARRVVVTKDGEQYVFACREGDEAQVFCCLVDYAFDDRHRLTWTDAFLLIRQLGGIMRAPECAGRDLWVTV